MDRKKPHPDTGTFGAVVADGVLMLLIDEAFISRSGKPVVMLPGTPKLISRLAEEFAGLLDDDFALPHFFIEGIGAPPPAIRELLDSEAETPLATAAD